LRQNRWEYVSDSVLEDVPWSEELKEHFASAVGSGSTHASLLKLAALLHDISKPETKIMANGRVRFYGHTEQGAEVASGILERLRFSQKEIRLVETMVRYHLRPTQMSHEGMPTRRAVYRYLRDTDSVAIDILFLSLADHLAARGPDLDQNQWQWHVEQTRYILADFDRQAAIVAPPKLIDGHDIMREFGLKPGPEIREILESVREARASGELSTREEALYYVKNRLLYRKQNLT
jgi:poly(A) polymerase